MYTAAERTSFSQSSAGYLHMHDCPITFSAEWKALQMAFIHYKGFLGYIVPLKPTSTDLQSIRYKLHF